MDKIDQKQINLDYEWLLMQNLSKYRGQWIAILNKEIITRDYSLKNVIKKVSSMRLKVSPLYIQVPEESIIT